MRILNPRNITNNGLYIFSYCLLMFIASIYTYSEFNSVNMVSKPHYITIVWYFSLLLFLSIQVFLAFRNISISNNRNKNYFYLFIIFSTLLIVFFHLKIMTLTMILLFLLVCNSNIINFDLFLKYDLITRFISFLVIVLMFFLNMFPVANSTQTIRRGDVIRNSLGFNHPNTLGGYFLIMLFVFLLYVNSKTDISLLSVGKKISLFIFVLLTSVYFEVILANSRSSEIAMIIIIPALCAYMIYKFKVPKQWIGMAILIVTMVIAIFLSYFYDPSNDIISKMNVISSNRLFLQHTALHQYGFGLLGNPLFTQGKPFWIDNQYVFNLLCIGILGSAIYLIFMYVVFKNSFKGNNYLLFVILISIVIKSAFESTATDYYSFLPFIYSFKYFYFKD